MDPWPDRWIVDDWADEQLMHYTEFHGGRGRFECIDGYVEWVGPFRDFNVDRDGTARGPITLISMRPTSESVALRGPLFEDLDTMYEVMSPPTRIATGRGFLINGTAGLYMVKAPHPDEESCPHPFCAG